MLLNGEIKNDNRVIKMIRTLSQRAYVDLYYVNGVDTDNSIFNKNVNLYSSNYKASFRRKIIQHSFFIWEFNFFFAQVVNKKVHYDYVWCNDLPTLNPGLKIAKKMGAKLIYDSHEIYLETLNQFFPRKTNGVKKIIFKLNLEFMRFIGRKFNRIAIPQVDTFITVNESLQQYFRSKYKVKNQLVLMNFPELDKRNASINFRQLFQWKDDDVILIYQGALNEGRGLRLLIDVMNTIDDKYKLIVLGNGPLKPFLKALLYPKNKQVKFIDRVPIEKLLEHTRGADIGVNLLEDFNISKKLASPNKLFEYIHAKTPVLCSNTIENSRVVTNYDIGVLTENNKSSVQDSIIALSKKQKKMFESEMTRARKNFNWEKQEPKILDILKNE